MRSGQKSLQVSSEPAQSWFDYVWLVSLKVVRKILPQTSETPQRPWLLSTFFTNPCSGLAGQCFNMRWQSRTEHCNLSKRGLQWLKWLKKARLKVLKARMATYGNTNWVQCVSATHKSKRNPASCASMAKHGLLVRSGALKEHSNLWLEAHVKHPVGLRFARCCQAHGPDQGTE